MAARATRAHDGFSLVELLVVIVVLGILATVAVFAVRGATSNAQQTSCLADVKVIDKAEQLFETENTEYGTEDQLVGAGYLHSPSTLHDVTVGSGSYTIVATNACAGGAGAATTSTTVPPTTAPPTTVPAATTLSMSSAPSSVVAGSVLAPITVIVQDSSGQAVTGSTASITISLSVNPGGASLGGTRTVAAVAGVATFNDLTVDKSGTGYAFTASASGLSSATSGSFAVTPATPDRVVVRQQPTAGITATAFPTQPVFELDDVFGNLATSSTASVTLAIVPGTGAAGAVLTCTTNPVAAVAGVATFAGCKINLAGTGYRLTATASGLTAATTGAFSVSGPATTMVFTVQPTTSIVNAPMAPDVTVTVVDAAGRTVTASTASITLTPSTAGMLVGTVTSSAVSGVATFTGLSVNRLGTNFKLTASSSGLTSVVSAAFNTTFGAASRLAFTTQPAGATVGVVWTTQPRVTVLDAYGNTVTSSTANVTLAITSGTGASGAALTCTANPKAAVSGVATFAGCKIGTLGSGYTLTASAAGVTDAISTAFDNPFGAVTKLVFTQQPTAVTAGSSIAPSITVAAEDALNQIVTTSAAVISIAITTNPGSGALSGTTSATVVNGVATFSNLSINKSGTGYKVTASSGALSVISSAFNVTAGAAAKLSFSTQPGGGAVNTAWATQPKVTVQDSLGNTVTTSTASLSLAITSGTGTAGATLACTANPKAAVAGIATFAGCKVSKSGAGYTLTATSSGLTSTTSSTFTIS